MQGISRTRVCGPLAPLADGFRAELDRLGYTPKSREYKVRQMAALSCWLEGRGLGAGDVDAARVGAFLPKLATEHKRPPTLKAMRPLLGWLRAQGVIGADPPAPRAPVD